MDNKNFLKENKPSLDLYHLDLPKILFNKYKKDNSPNKIAKTNPSIKRKIDQYNNIRSFLHLPKIEVKSPRYYQILKTENIKELARNNLQSNKNIFSYIKDKSKSTKNNIVEKLTKKDSDNIYTNKIKNIIRMHSSKYHPEAAIKNSLNNEFDIILKKLKYGKYDSNNDDREIKYRQRLAFKYRFLQNDKNITPLNFKKMNMKMNKLLNISKSIPNYLLKNIKSNERNQDEDNKQFNSINTSINISCIYSKNNRSNKFLYESSTKRTMNNEEKLKRNKKNNIIYSCDKNGRKYLRRLSLLL